MSSVKSRNKLPVLISSTSIRQALLFNPFTCVRILFRYNASMGEINNCNVGFILDYFVNIIRYILFADHITTTTFNNIMVIMLLRIQFFYSFYKSFANYLIAIIMIFALPTIKNTYIHIFVYYRRSVRCKVNQNPSNSIKNPHIPPLRIGDNFLHKERFEFLD